MAAHNPSLPAWTRRSTSRPSAPPPSPGALSSETQFPSLPPAVAPRKPFIPRHQLPRHSPPREPAPPAPSPLATPAPAPPPAPPAGHVLVTKDALEWMLSSFGLILASLLKLAPNWKALQAIAKATVQEYFPDLTPPATTPQHAAQISSQPQLSLSAKITEAPPIRPQSQSQMEVSPPSHSRGPGLTSATAAFEKEKQALGLQTNNTMPTEALPNRSRLILARRRTATVTKAPAQQKTDH